MTDPAHHDLERRHLSDGVLSDDFAAGYLAGWEDRNTLIPPLTAFVDELTEHQIERAGLTSFDCSCGERVPYADVDHRIDFIAHLADIARRVSMSTTHEDDLT